MGRGNGHLVMLFARFKLPDLENGWGASKTFSSLSEKSSSCSFGVLVVVFVGLSWTMTDIFEVRLVPELILSL